MRKDGKAITSEGLEFPVKSGKSYSTYNQRFKNNDYRGEYNRIKYNGEVKVWERNAIAGKGKKDNVQINFHGSTDREFHIKEIVLPPDVTHFHLNSNVKVEEPIVLPNSIQWVHVPMWIHFENIEDFKNTSTMITFKP